MSWRVLYVVGARPNFVKLAPLVHALSARPQIEGRALHTGQHYDWALSGAFIERLSFPQPHYNLDVGSGTHAEQTAAVLVGVERVLTGERFDAIIVSGDVNSTMAAALAGVKAGVPVVHLESGLRSRDWTMPEEINRVVTDRVSELLLCHCKDAVDNLLAEGMRPGAIALVGNTMIDSLIRLLDDERAAELLERSELVDRGYVLVTLHRPALVDDDERLAAVVAVLAEVAESVPVVFPLHPRTRARLTRVPPTPQQLRFTEPLEYGDFLALESRARFVITDSGGVQEETSALGVPCITYRDNTERAITVELGTNRLVGVDPEALSVACNELLRAERQSPPEIPLWDGRAGARAADAVMALLERRRPAGTAGVEVATVIRQ